jgi:hypothetical protein
MKLPSEALSGRFPIGIDSVPIRYMKEWAARGCNLIVRSDLEGENVQPRQWADAAAEFGFKTIRPATTPVEDAKDATLIAVNLPDEPDLSNHFYGIRPPGGWPAGIKVFDSFNVGGAIYDLVGKEQGNPPIQTGATIQGAITVYRAKAAALRLLYPNMPIFGNLAGNSVTSGMKTEAYEGFTADIDWIGSDWYPVDADLAPFPLPIAAVRRYSYYFPAMAAGRLSAWSKGKPQFAYISIVSQRLDKSKAGQWRWPDTREIECQVWAALASGVAGIVYFAVQQNPWRSDGISSTVNGDYAQPGTMPPELVKAAVAVRDWLPTFNNKLQQLADFLNKGNRIEISAAYANGAIVAAIWTLKDKSELKVAVNVTASVVATAGGEFLPCEVKLTVAPTAAPAPIPTPLPPITDERPLLERVAAVEQKLAAIASILKK